MNIFKFLSLTLLFFCSLGSSSNANLVNFNLDFIKSLHELSLSTDSGVASMDQITFAMVDTSLFLIQMGKYGLYQSYFGPILLFDWVYNTSRVECNPTCVREDYYIEIREPSLFNVDRINLTTNFETTTFNVKLNVPDLFFSSPGYRHTIVNNVTGQTRIGEFSYISIVNAEYGITADYKLIPGLGIQVSNVDLTLDMGNSTRTVETRHTILANGMIIDEGLMTVPIGENVMNAWKGDHEGEPMETQYEKWAEFVINCGLSGGKSNADCADLAVLKQRKFPNFATAL